MSRPNVFWSSDDDDDDSYSIRHWTDVPPGEVCFRPSSRGRLRSILIDNLITKMAAVKNIVSDNSSD